MKCNCEGKNRHAGIHVQFILRDRRFKNQREQSEQANKSKSQGNRWKNICSRYYMGKPTGKRNAPKCTWKIQDFERIERKFRSLYSGCCEVQVWFRYIGDPPSCGESGVWPGHARFYTNRNQADLYYTDLYNLINLLQIRNILSVTCSAMLNTIYTIYRILGTV